MDRELEKFTDEELVTMAAGGESAAEEYLIRKYMPEIRARAHLYFIVGGDSEDIVQEGMIGIFKAIKAFDPNRGVSFHGFMTTCVDHQIYTAIEKAGRLKHLPLNMSMPLITEDGETNPEVGRLHCAIENEPEASLIFKDMIESLKNNEEKLFSAMELKVWHEYLNGANYIEIARSMGRSEKSIDNALQRIKKKITDYLNC